MTGEWYGKTLSERVREWFDAAAEKIDSPITNGMETYDKIAEARRIAERLEAAASDDDPDPKEALDVLTDAQDLLHELKITGRVPNAKTYIMLAKHAAEAARTAVTIDQLRWYEQYKANREAGQSHEEAVRSLPIWEREEEKFKLRYELRKHKQEADAMEVSRRDCDVCGRSRRVDVLYDCARCNKRACNYCMSPSNEADDDDAYCRECRTACTHCGLQYADDQITRCKTDDKPYCDDYMGTCDVGGGDTCLAHLSPCNVCGDTLCEEHERLCAANNEIVGGEHLIACRGCGEEYCEIHFDPSIEEAELEAA